MHGRSRRAWKHFLYSNLFLALTLAAVFLVGFGLFRVYYENYQVNREIGQLQEQAAQLEAKRLQTLSVLHYVQSPAFAKKVARTQLNLVEPGEHAALITNVSSTSMGAQQDLTSSPVSNAVKWWRIFIN